MGNQPKNGPDAIVIILDLSLGPVHAEPCHQATLPAT